MDSITIPVALYVADKLVAQFIKEEGYSRIKKNFFPKKTYILRLRDILLESINEFESQNQVPDEADKIPFYVSQVCFVKLSTYILFDESSNPISKEVFVEDDRIKIPSEKEVADFYKLFIDKINSDRTLRKLRIEEGYKEKIFEVERVLKQIPSQLTNIQDSLGRIEERLEQNHNVLLQQQFLDDLQFPKDQLNSKNPNLALSFLEGFKTKNWARIDDTLKHKVLVNIGLCKIDINRPDEAAALLIEALQYNSNDSNANGYAAIGYCLIKNKEKAQFFADKSLEKNPLGVNAWVAKIETTELDNNIEEIIQTVPSELLTNSTIAFSLHKFSRKQDNLVEAEKWMQIAFENDLKRDPDILASYGSILLERITDPFSLVTQQISFDSRSLAVKGVALLTEAIDKIDDKDIKKYRWRWWVNRAIGKKVIGDFNGALLDIQTAFSFNTEDFNTIRHLAIALRENKQYPKSLEIFKKLKEKRPDDPIIELAIAEGEIQVNKLGEALDRLESLVERDLKQEIKDQATSLLIKVKTDLGETKAAEEKARNILAERVNYVEGHFDLVFVLEKKRRFEDAKEIVLKSYELVTEDAEQATLAELADLLFKYEQFEKAAKIYSKIVDTSVYTPLSEKLIHSYLGSGEKVKALEIAEKLKQKYGLLPSIVKIESFIYESIGDVDTAIRICEDFLYANEDHQEILVRLVNLYFRKDDKEKVKHYLSFLRDYSRFPYQLRFRLSYLYTWIGNVNQGLEVSYATWRDHHSEGKVHLAFIQSAQHLPIDMKLLMNLPFIEIDTTAIILNENRQPHAFTILIADKLYEDRGEISPDSDLAKLLLGKKLGDRIILDKDMGVSETYEVAAILHKYAHAQRESFELLASKFIDTEGFTVLNLKKSEGEPTFDDYFKPVKELIDRGHEQKDDILKIYKSGILPIGTLSSFSNENPIKIWGGLLNEEMGILTGAQIPNEYPTSVGLLAQGSKVLVDIVSILTLSELKLLEKVKEKLSEINVAISTVELIREEILKLKRRDSVGYLTVYKRDGQYYKHEVTKDAIEKNLDYLNQLFVWIQSNCNILPCEKALTINSFEKERNDKLFGQSFYETVLIAQDKGMILLSDDGVFRTYANQEYKINGLSSKRI